MSNKIYDFIIVGGGSGGIGAAVEASAFGFKNILLVEKGDNHSQTIRQYYKDNKRVDKDYKGQVTNLLGHVDFRDNDKNGTLNYFDSLLDNNEIDTIFNCEVDQIKKDGDTFNVATGCGLKFAKNVIIAIGIMGRPNKPHYKLPISLSSKINFNLEKCSQGENILIVGGGNSACEYAISLSKNNTITLNYRKEKFTRLNEKNEEDLQKLVDNKDIKLLLGKDIVELANQDGKIQVSYDDASIEIYDRIVYAIGGTTPVDFLKKCNIDVNEKGFPIYDENYETNIKNLFICGDLATPSGGSIAMALNQAYKIISYLKKD